MALLLIILSAVLWAGEIVKPELDFSMIQNFVNFVSAIYWFIMFGILEKIAKDNKSSRKDTIKFLKFFNLIIYVVLLVVSLIANRMTLENVTFIITTVGLVALASAIITAVVLFKLRKEIKEEENKVCNI